MNTRPPILQFRTVRGEPHLFSPLDPGPSMSFARFSLKHRFSMNEIARALNVSVSTLRTSFIDYAGIPPKQWMAQHRVLLSTRMLRQGISIEEVIEKLGYHDHSHMGKEFKLLLGTSPKKMERRLHAMQQTA